MRTGLVAVMLVAAVFSVRAAEPHVSAYVEERQARMRGMEEALLVLELMARGVLPHDPQLAARKAADLAIQAGGIADSFGDTPASRWGPTSRAAQSVWTDRADFLVRAADLEARALALIDIARDPDARALLPGAVAEMRATCESCHARHMKR
ncbi:MAG: hypothetical protein KatS3mg118_0811 [Paracoccaceae bacterium]|nr:MAG: hypothetical protein KatS3mg118_0811 [Paracoccaceae bacterium]